MHVERPGIALEDSLEQIEMPYIHKDREYRTILQIMQVDPVVLDLANCNVGVYSHISWFQGKSSCEIESMRHETRITDSLISNVLKHAPVLRFLNLSGNTNLSMRCLQGAITKTLENLSLEGTSCVSYPKQLALLYISNKHYRFKSERRGMER